MSNITKNPLSIKEVIHFWLEKEISRQIDISNTLKSLKVTVDSQKGSGRYKTFRSFSTKRYQLWSAPQKKPSKKCVSELKLVCLSSTQNPVFPIESTHIGAGKPSLITLQDSRILSSQFYMNSIKKLEGEEGKLGISINKRKSFFANQFFEKYNLIKTQFFIVKNSIKLS